jgi:hypothetical protein
MVSVVLDNLAAGESPEEIIGGYHLRREDIEAAVAYALTWPANGWSHCAQVRAHSFCMELGGEVRFIRPGGTFDNSPAKYS